MTIIFVKLGAGLGAGLDPQKVGPSPGPEFLGFQPRLVPACLGIFLLKVGSNAFLTKMVKYEKKDVKFLFYSLENIPKNIYEN
jgi:hypothetical protein